MWPNCHGMQTLSSIWLPFLLCGISEFVLMLLWLFFLSAYYFAFLLGFCNKFSEGILIFISAALWWKIIRGHICWFILIDVIHSCGDYYLSNFNTVNVWILTVLVYLLTVFSILFVIRYQSFWWKRISQVPFMDK